MAVTNTPDAEQIKFDNAQPRRLNRKERRANLAKAQQALRAWKKKGGGTSVAPPEPKAVEANE
jgi:hypothetical protein